MLIWLVLRIIEFFIYLYFGFWCDIFALNEIGYRFSFQVSPFDVTIYAPPNSTTVKSVNELTLQWKYNMLQKNGEVYYCQVYELTRDADRNHFMGSRSLSSKKILYSRLVAINYRRPTRSQFRTLTRTSDDSLDRLILLFSMKIWTEIPSHRSSTLPCSPVLNVLSMLTIFELW